MRALDSSGKEGKDKVVYKFIPSKLYFKFLRFTSGDHKYNKTK